jgi:hypothetical protein
MFFFYKTRFVSMSVTSVFLRVFSKVSAAIAKIDIYKMSKFLGKKRRPIGIYTDTYLTIYAVMYGISRKVTIL